MLKAIGHFETQRSMLNNNLDNKERPLHYNNHTPHQAQQVNYQ